MALLVTTSTARADFFLSGSSGNLAASVRFHDDGAGHLVVTLTNTASFESLANPGVLMAVFWDVGATAALTPGTAALGSGSTEANGGDATQLGGGWQYKNVAGGFGQGINQHFGISATGLNGLFGPNGNFSPGSPTNLDGVNWGIVTSNYVNGDGSGVMTSSPLERDSVVFTLNGWTLGDPGALTGFGNIRFQYGTSPSEPFFPNGGPVVPVPAGIVLLGIGSGLTGLVAWRKRRQTKTA
jgi:hypothetical protein